MPSYTFNKQCGPDAIDNYDKYQDSFRGNSKFYSRSHTIAGTGAIERCYANGSYRYEDSYNISNGITELCDNCFSNSSVTSVTLPSTLTIIGNKCFKDSLITYINLPDGLTRIGHSNFPSTLNSIKIPPLIKELPIDNFTECRSLYSITVDENNEYYKSKDGILYNHDMTEILFCPNAKEGTVVIPNTVTRIGDFCFAKCMKLEKIVIPTSVVEIGNHAFNYIHIKKLIIRNNIKSIGAGCFANAHIAEEFKLSQQISSLPQKAFDSFEGTIKPDLINHLEFIGEDTFSCSQLPEKITLYCAKEIQSRAFHSVVGIKAIELFSSIEKMGDNIFEQIDNRFFVRWFGFAPMHISEDTFKNMGKEATLVVPKGTKMIFENASPWACFPVIEEWETSIDKDENGNEVTVTDEIYYKRLQSLSASKEKADRFYLKEIITELSQSYLYVDSDEEYNEALSLIAYNRSFFPAIAPDLEIQLCREWANSYKLKIINYSITKSHASPLVFSDHVEKRVLPQELPLPKPVDITPLPVAKESDSVIAYFNQDILKQLQNHLTLASLSVKIAVSWFTNYSLFKQILQMAKDGIKIQLITNNDLINNGGYCLNFNELIDNGVEISLVEYPHLIHHKFVIIDNNILITGSYNWTRFSGKNYENMVVINDEHIIEQFCNEFDELLGNAEYKCIDKMPDYVKERPEYDRSAFKQYITEELDAQARESSDERDKITALKKAAELNPKYLEKINPGVQEKYSEAFKVAEDKKHIQEIILNELHQPQMHQTKGLNTTPSKDKSSHTNSKVFVEKVLTREQEAKIENIKASNLIMVLDVSGSMSETYTKGHVHEITKKALAASLTLTDNQEVNIWTFGNDATFIGSFGLNKIDQINQITCKNEGTELKKFVDKANDSIKDDAFCIIFTDDDARSISDAIEGMKKREKVFWQIIAYESDLNNIKANVKDISNTSVITLSDYKSKTDEEISKLLLKDYLTWKSGKSN